MKWTPEQHAKLVEMYPTDATIQQIAEATGHSITSCWWYGKTHRLSRKNQGGFKDGNSGRTYTPLRKKLKAILLSGAHTVQLLKQTTGSTGSAVRKALGAMQEKGEAHISAYTREQSGNGQQIAIWSHGPSPEHAVQKEPPKTRPMETTRRTVVPFVTLPFFHERVFSLQQEQQHGRN
jgi:hypothetical protein